MAIILCDLDGTLLVKARRDPPGVVSPKRAAINRALAEVCAAPAVDFSRGLEHGLTDWQISERAVRLERPGARIDGARWREVCARAEAVFAPSSPDPAQPLYRRLAGVPEILLALRAAGHSLGLVTGNVSFFALFKLEQAGIDRALFNGPAAFGDHGRERADILRAALARAGDAAGPMIVLGDTVHDLAGARAVGLPFLGTGAMGLRREDVLGGERSANVPPVQWVADLGEAPAVLRAVARLAQVQR